MNNIISINSSEKVNLILPQNDKRFTSTSKKSRKRNEKECQAIGKEIMNKINNGSCVIYALDGTITYDDIKNLKAQFKFYEDLTSKKTKIEIVNYKQNNVWGTEKDLKELKDILYEFAKGKRDSKILKTIFGDTSVNLDVSQFLLNNIEFGQFCEALAKEYFYILQTNFSLRLKNNEHSKIREGTTGSAKLDLILVNNSEKLIIGVSSKMHEGKNVAYTEGDAGNTVLKTMGFRNKYYPNYRVKAGFITFDGLTKDAHNELKDDINSHEFNEYIDWQYKDLQNWFIKLQSHYIANKFQSNEANRSKISPRWHQLNVLNKYSDKLSEQKFSILLAHACRTGKTYTALLLIREYLNQNKNVKLNILLTSGIPSLFPQWEQSILDIFGKKANIINLSTKENLQLSDSKINFILTSTQMLFPGNYFDVDNIKISKDEKKIVERFVHSKIFDFFLLDECHSHVLAPETKKLLDKIKYDKMIGLTATPFRDGLWAKFKYSDEFSYYDKERQKINGNVDYLNDPSKIQILVTPDDKYIKNISKRGFWDKNSGPSLKLMFDNFGNNQTLIEDLLYMLYYNVYNGVEIKEGLNKGTYQLHDGIWIVDSEQAAKKLYKLLIKFKNPDNPDELLFKNFNFTYFTSKEYNSKKLVQESKSLFNRNDKNKKHNIAIVVRQLITGHTFPTVDHTVLLSEMTSLITLIQSGERGGTRHEYIIENTTEEKKCYFVFDMSMYRQMSLKYAIRQENKRNENTLSEKEINEICPLYAKNHAKTEILKDEIVENYITLWRMNEIKKRELFSLPNIIWNGSQVFSELVELTKGDKNLNLTNINLQNSNSEFKKAKSKSKRIVINNGFKSKDDSISKKEMQIALDLNATLQFIQLVLNYLGIFSAYLYFSNENYIFNTYNKVIDDTNDIVFDMFKKDNRIKSFFEQKQLQIDKNNLKELFSLCISDKDIVDEKIKMLSQEFNKMGKDKVIYTYLQSDYCIKEFGEVFTPIKLVNMMLDKLPKKVWSNPDLKWLDPSCGTGHFLIVIFQRLMIGLKNKFPDENKRKKHILENMIYGVDIQSKNTYLCQLILDTENKYKLNIVCEDSLKFNFWNMKFDVIVGNPPYNKDIVTSEHGDYYIISGDTANKIATYAFIKLAIDFCKDSGYILYVNPCTYMVGQNASSIRKYIIQNCDIISIDILPEKQFDNIATYPAVSLFKKGNFKNSISFSRYINDIKYECITEYIREYNIIPLPIGQQGMNILKKYLFAKNIKLNSISPTLHRYDKKINGKKAESDLYTKDNKIPVCVGFDDNSKPEVKYFPNDEEYVHKKKLIFHRVVHGALYTINQINKFHADYNGKYGVGWNLEYIPAESDLELKELEEYLPSKEINFILTQLKDSTNTSYDYVNLLPSPHNLKVKLSQSDIKYIEKIVKPYFK